MRQNFGGKSIAEVCEELNWDYQEFYKGIRWGLFPSPSNKFGNRKYYTPEQVAEIKRIDALGEEK